jgi:hypothetical protein
MVLLFSTGANVRCSWRVIFELNLGTEEEKFRHPISKDGFAHGL